MTREDVRARIQEIAIIPSVRMSSAEDAMFAAEAVAEGGIPIVEVPMTVPGAIAVIRSLVLRNPNMIVGAGTVLDAELAQQCIDAGAAFLTSTGFEGDVVSVAVRQGVVSLPGALTPTEAILAHKSGADFVKIFPCSQVGGASYIKSLKAPLAHVPLIASGGVNQKNIAEFFQAGAVAVGIGSNLIPAEAVDRREPSWIAKLAGQYIHLVTKARGRHAS